MKQEYHWKMKERYDRKMKVLHKIMHPKKLWHFRSYR
jgi:hypothetical protein